MPLVATWYATLIVFSLVRPLLGFRITWLVIAMLRYIATPPLTTTVDNLGSAVLALGFTLVFPFVFEFFLI